MKQEVKIGQEDYTVLILVRDSTTGAPKTGLTFESAGIDVCYTRVETDNDVVLTAGAPVTTTLTGAHVDWGFVKVDDTNAPGLYKLDIADGVFSAGAWSAVVSFICTGCDPVHIEFVLVPSDPYTGVSLNPAQPETTFEGIISTGGITVTQASGNAPGLSLTGNGTGPGALITGGNNSGTGLAVMGGVLNGIGIYAKGQGSGEGLRVDGGDGDGNAVEFNGGATNSSGLKITGAGTGHGVSILGGSGATGYGVNKAAQSTNGYGLHSQGTGSGGGIKAAGGAEGNGIEAVGGGTSGNGLYAKAAGTGDGIAAHGGGIAGDGLSATADNDGDGLQATGVGAGHTDFNPDISGSMDTLATYVDTEVASILAAVDTEVATLITELAKVPKSDGAVSWNSTALTAAATALLDLANAVETGISVRNALRLAILAGAGKLSGAGTDTEILLNPGGTKNRVTATVDEDGNRSAIVLDLT